MKRFFPFFILLIHSLCALEMDSNEPQITVNNRILATVNGRTISVLDVMKKMEVYLARHYPGISNTQRFQFFSTNWRQIFAQMVDNELMLADAEQVQLKISDSEIRETMHERFGPSIMPTLDSLGISYDEAWQMIYSEMATQRMTYFRVHSKALQRTIPFDVKNAYKKYRQENPPTQQWKYQLLSIRSANETIGNSLAQKAFQLIHDQKLSFADVAKTLKENPDITVQVSEEYDISSKDLSQAHKKVLMTLKPGMYSAPMTQISRVDKSIVHRIFYLKECKEIAPPPFQKMTETLHDELVEKEIAKEMPAYLKRLREKFNVDEKSIEALPRDFQPFVLA